MKLTKKQLTVLQKIVGREQERYNQDAFEQNRSTNKMQRAKIAGVHPCGERFGITDGVLAVLFDENGKNGANNWGEPIFLMPCRPN